MKVRDLMTRPPITIRDTDDVALALQHMAWGEVRHLPVLREGRLVGVVSERDLLANRFGNPSLAEVMSAPAQVAAPEDDVTEAARRMVEQRLGCLPVVDKSGLVGILTVTDLVAAEAKLIEVERGGRLAVRDAMTRTPLCVGEDELLLDAVSRMADRDVRHAPVLDADGRVVAMLSDRDVRLALGASLLAIPDGAAAPKVRLLRVRDAMTKDPIVAREETPLKEAAAAFLNRHVGALPVVDEGRRITGILSYVDVLRALAGGLV